MNEVNRSATNESLRASGVKRGACIGHRNIGTEVNISIDDSNRGCWLTGNRSSVTNRCINRVDIVIQNLSYASTSRVSMEVNLLETFVIFADGAILRG